MGKRGPQRGSHSYWHRSRAQRKVARIRTWNPVGKGLAGFAGYKAGMASAFMVDDSATPTEGQEIVVPVTVLEVPPMFVYSVVAYGKEMFGFKAIGESVATTVPKQLKRAIPVAKKSKASLDDLAAKNPVEYRVIAFTQPFKAGFGQKTPDVMEIALAGTPAEQLEYAKSVLGKEVKASDVLQLGEFLDTIAVTKGKGWQGIVKRFGVALGFHKSTQSRRHGGSIGGERQAKVMYTIPRAGQMGFHRRTDFNKRVLYLSTDSTNLPQAYRFYGVVKNEFLVLRGSIPGPAKRLVRLRRTLSRRQGNVKAPQVRFQ
ncbi:50S ribosomal protein L3 [Candidatus Micrarchaeota archaeon CG1_02_55_22]|nr:MAG: 50S ribosomal protein L3 [Candidatus Micrarchaeota archaeon CG1_02_55_22]